MNIIFGNYGNQTIAVIQWAKQQNLQDVTVISVDTGWEADGWLKRVKQAEAFVKSCGFKAVRLHSSPKFQELMQDRGNFPSTKFQWCAGFLKGLALIDWLDNEDLMAEAMIVLGKRRLDSRISFALEEFIKESEHYGDRKVWHPLYNHSDKAFEALLLASGLDILAGRSLECDPCVNSYGNDLARLQDKDIIKTEKLEQAVGTHIFSLPIADMVKQARQKPEDSKHMFDMGCGSPYACGE